MSKILSTYLLRYLSYSDRANKKVMKLGDAVLGQGLSF